MFVCLQGLKRHINFVLVFESVECYTSMNLFAEASAHSLDRPGSESRSASTKSCTSIQLQFLAPLVVFARVKTRVPPVGAFWN